MNFVTQKSLHSGTNQANKEKHRDIITNKIGKFAA